MKRTYIVFLAIVFLFIANPFQKLLANPQSILIDFNQDNDLVNNFLISNNKFNLHQEPSGGITGGMITYPPQDCINGCTNELEYKNPLPPDGFKEIFKASMSFKTSLNRPSSDRVGGIGFRVQNALEIIGFGFVVFGRAENSEFDQTFSNAKEIIYWMFGRRSIEKIDVERKGYSWALFVDTIRKHHLSDFIYSDAVIFNSVPNLYSLSDNNFLSIFGPNSLAIKPLFAFGNYYLSSAGSHYFFKSKLVPSIDLELKNRFPDQYQAIEEFWLQHSNVELLITNSNGLYRPLFSASSLNDGHWYKLELTVTNDTGDGFHFCVLNAYDLGENGLLLPQLAQSISWREGDSYSTHNILSLYFETEVNSPVLAYDDFSISNISAIPPLVPDRFKSLTKDPIDIFGGEMFASSTDFLFLAQGPILKLSRKYHSMSNFKGLFGNGWHTAYDQNLSEDKDGNITVYDEDGVTRFFVKSSNGSYKPSLRDSFTIVKNQDGTCTLTDKHGVKTMYSAQGRMTQVVDRNGNTLKFVYDSANANGTYLEDSTGRRITLTLNKDGHVTEAVDPAGHKIQYGYDENENLISIKDALGHTASYGYDKDHHIIEMTNANGHKTYYAYDTNGRAYQNWQDADVNKTTLNFHANNTTVLTDALNNPTTYVFNDMGLEISRTDSLGHTRTKEWDAHMNKAAETDERGQKTSFYYDDKDNLINKVDALGQNFYSYDVNFNLIKSVMDHFTREITNYTYDPKGNLLVIQDKLGKKTLMTYDAAGNVRSIKDALNNTTVMDYNAYGQLIRKTNALGKATQFDYDVLGNIASVIDPKGNKTVFTYNDLNRLTKKTFADGTGESYEYDAFGNKTKVIDQKGLETTSIYDAFERLTKIIDPSGGVIACVYDKLGRTLKLTDAKNQTTAFTYDALGRLLTETTPLGHATTYSYDDVGNILTKTDANGKTVSYTYDELNRLIKIAYPDRSQISYTYDHLGRKASMADSRGTTTYTYDDLDHLVLEKGPGDSGVIKYTYDAVGNRTSMTNQNGAVTNYTYDQLNRLQTVKDNNGTTFYAYDENSNLMKTSYPNGTSAINEHDRMNRVLRMVNQGPKNNILSMTTNQYDKAGMVIKKLAKDLSWMEYVYDKKNQLIGETKKTASSSGKTIVLYDHEYNYDIVGNRTLLKRNFTLPQFLSQEWPRLPKETKDQLTTNGFSPFNSKNISYAMFKVYKYDADNRLLSSRQYIDMSKYLFYVGDVHYNYDNNGNRILKSELMAGNAWPFETRYIYDFENRLTRLDFSADLDSLGAKNARFEYDSNGRRIKAYEGHHVTNFLYDGANVILAKDTGALAEDSYTRGLDYGGGIGGIISKTRYPFHTQYFHYNTQGSVTGLSFGNGSVSTSYNYEAYGQTTPSWQPGQNPYRFSTKEWLGYANLYYFGARYYDPEAGRWLTPDPLGFVDGLNNYLYTNNNPVNLIDPNGNAGIPLDLALIIAFAGGIINGSAEAYVALQNRGDVVGAFRKGLVSGVVGTSVGIAVAASGTKNPSLIAASASLGANLTDQLISNGGDFNNLNTASAVQATALGAVLGPVVQNIPGLQTVGQLPNLFLSRSLSQFGPNSLRLIGQEGAGDILSSIFGSLSNNNNFAGKEKAQ